MVTDGLILLASIEQNELHFLYAADDEYSLGLTQLQRCVRDARTLNSTDMTCAPFRWT